MNREAQIEHHLKAHKATGKKHKTAYFRQHLLPFFNGKLEDRAEHHYYHCAELNCQYYAKSDKAFFIHEEKWVENGARKILFGLDLI